MDSDSASYHIERVLYPVPGKAVEGGPFPQFKCPRNYYLPIGAWPHDQIYDALPGGGNWYNNFFGVLARDSGVALGEGKLSHTQILNDPQVYADATNLIFFWCDSLYAATTSGFAVDAEGNYLMGGDGERERIPIIILGLPDRPPREDQIELVLNLVQMRREDLIKVRLQSP